MGNTSGISEQYEVILWLTVLISSLGKSFLGSSNEIIILAVGNVLHCHRF